MPDPEEKIDLEDPKNNSFIAVPHDGPLAPEDPQESKKNDWAGSLEGGDAILLNEGRVIIQKLGGGSYQILSGDKGTIKGLDESDMKTLEKFFKQ